MSTKPQTFRLPLDLITAIEDMNKGSKTELIIDLLRQSIAMRNVREVSLDVMYSAAKNDLYESGADFSPSDIRNIIDGLNI